MATPAALRETLIWVSGSGNGGALVSNSLLGALLVVQRWIAEAGGGAASSCMEALVEMSSHP